MVVWTGKRVAEHIETPPDIKIEPNGVELAIEEVWRIDTESEATFSGKVREIDIPKLRVYCDGNGFYHLTQGVYEIRLANRVKIPKNAIGITLPRSTLNRLGVIKSESALWDAGYEGNGTQTIFVPIKRFRIHKDEFWFQMIFLDAEEAGEAYNGYWQKEELAGKDQKR